MTEDTQKRVYHLLHQLSSEGLTAAKLLFCTELNYEHANRPLSTRNWPDKAQKALIDPPRILAQHGDFYVIYAQLSPARQGRAFPLSVVAERDVIKQLLPDHPYALFLFSDADATHWHLVNVKLDKAPDTSVNEATAPGATMRQIFRRIAVGPQERLRTASERVAMLDLASLSPDLTGLSPLLIQERHDRAFDVEAVTRKFFSDYRRIFEDAEAQIEGLEGEALRLFTQRLFNRLLFITFLERKGWLTFDGHGDYLRPLWDDHRAATAEDPETNFYRDRLTLLFFSGLNSPQSADLMRVNRGGFLRERIGQVPYLNGGLFEKERLDGVEGVTVPDAIFGPVFDDLIYHYNFTVTESTPLDVEVAVDPEMLGKIFEELVTGRQESGSYYTPKPIVAFMCREALKGYLADVCPQETADGLAAFVDRRDAVQLHRPEHVLAALKDVRVCDLACGSGAYLVGMLHELVDLRQALFVSRGVDARAVYDKKLEIIQRSLYGVDIDPFAVNIARLRLWLSLIVDFEGETPPPLPNLEFKIEVGDSLIGPAPGQLQPDLFHHQQVEEYFRLKGQFMVAHGPEKAQLRQKIEELRDGIAEWASEGGGEGFDWAVTFAEVFAGPGWDTQTLTGGMTGVVNTAGGQMELAAQAGRPPGFDIVVANPPYVRQELLDPALKELLKKRYPEVYRGTADLYVYFYARALHLLREGGAGSFISSNKWLRAGYGKKLRAHLAEQATVDTVIDFGDLPLFEATAYPMIIVFRNVKAEEGHTLRALGVDVVDRLPEVVAEEAWEQPQASLRPDGWSLVEPEVRMLLKKLRRSGKPLGEKVQGQFNMGVKTGLNRAFIIDQATRDSLVAAGSGNAEVIRPWLRGRDVKRWKVEWGKQYIIILQNSGDKDAQNPWGDVETEAEARKIFRETYPAIYDHLSQYEERLRDRWDQGKFWWELRACAYYADFAKPKILYPDIAKRCEFAFDDQGLLSGNTTYFISVDDLALLGLLNSSVVDFFYRHISTMIQRDYLRFFTQYLEQIPIPMPTPDQREAIEALVSKLLAAHAANPPAGSEPAGGSEGSSAGGSVEAWEAELNGLVYQVYGLTDDEIAIVEEQCQ